MNLIHADQPSFLLRPAAVGLATQDSSPQVRAATSLTSDSIDGITAKAVVTLRITANVLERYGNYSEVVYENCGHSAHLEHPAKFRAALSAHLREADTRAAVARK
jgi:pimeloyl-ACP methyl ester carboxylesterase